MLNTLLNLRENKDYSEGYSLNQFLSIECDSIPFPTDFQQHLGTFLLSQRGEKSATGTRQIEARDAAKQPVQGQLPTTKIYPAPKSILLR